MASHTHDHQAIRAGPSYENIRKNGMPSDNVTRGHLAQTADSNYNKNRLTEKYIPCKSYITLYLATNPKIHDNKNDIIHSF